MVKLNRIPDHISRTKCKDIGLKIIELENDQLLQDAVLNLHHISMISFQKTTVVKFSSKIYRKLRW